MRQNLFAIVFSALMLSALSLSAQVGFVQKGEASYYASQFHGRPTASGERYNKNMMTASHKKLPFGTKVKVTNLANSKSVVVRINDRGPYVPRRIIDVSLAAATELDMLRAGVAPVKIEVIEAGDDSSTPQGLPESTAREDKGDDKRDDKREEVVLPEDDTEDSDNESDVQKSAQFEEGDGAVEEDEPAFVYHDDETDDVESADNTKRERLSAWSVGGTFDVSGNQRFPNGYTIQVGAFGAKENA
ncbi:MAG: septal ring lytic transglycosylase RlpA family protein, partial [Bacteroidota bacterium]